MAKTVLNVKVRKPGKDVLMMRKNGQIPAVLYGKKFDNEFFYISKKDFKNKIYGREREIGLIDLKKVEEKEPITVLIKEIQKNPLTSEIIHIDFYKVNLEEVIKHQVHLEFTGEAPAVKNFGGIFIKNLNLIEIECKAQDLISQIKVDITGLKELHNVLKIKDIKAPKNIKILADSEILIATIVEPKKEKEKEEKEEKTEEQAEKEAIEKIQGSEEKGKKEENKETADVADDKKKQDKKKK